MGVLVESGTSARVPELPDTSRSGSRVLSHPSNLKLLKTTSKQVGTKTDSHQRDAGSGAFPVSALAATGNDPGYDSVES